MFDNLYGGLESIQSMLTAISNAGYHIAVKQHPRATEGLELDHLNLNYLPTQLPAELIFTMVPDDAVVIGDLSSAMISAILMLGSKRVISIETQSGAFTAQMRPILHELDATIISANDLETRLRAL